VKRIQDGFDDRLDIFIELRIVETNEAIAVRFKECGSHSVARDLGRARMSFAVDFNYEAALPTQEICDVRTDWRLSHEFESADRPVLDAPP
jgi:hypothetical protein